MAKKKEQRKKTLSMPRRASLFWDTDPKSIDPLKHAKYIIERILDVGNEDEVRWLMNQYSKRKVLAIIRRSRGVLHKKSKALWPLVFSL